MNENMGYTKGTFKWPLTESIFTVQVEQKGQRRTDGKNWESKHALLFP